MDHELQNQNTPAPTGPAPSDRRLAVHCTLAAVMTLSVILSAWFSLRKEAADRQAEAVAAIRALGGWCFYDYQVTPVGVEFEVDEDAPSPVPAWLLGWLGVDFFHDIVDVNLVNHWQADHLVGECDRGTADDLKCLLGFPHLLSLSLHDEQASDLALSCIGRLSKLQDLYLVDAAAVTDAGIAHLANLHRLRFIHLTNSQITDASLAVLASLPQLSNLSLQSNRFTDGGLAYLEPMRQLTSLWIGWCNLDPCEAAISDAGLVHLQGLVNLEELDLQGLNVTLAGIEQLRGLTKLKLLFFEPVHEEGLANLAQDLARFHQWFPTCRTNESLPLPEPAFGADAPDGLVFPDPRQVIKINLWPLLPEPVYAYFPEMNLADDGSPEAARARSVMYWMSLTEVIYSYFVPEEENGGDVMLSDFESAVPAADGAPALFRQDDATPLQPTLRDAEPLGPALLDPDSADPQPLGPALLDPAGIGDEL